MDLHRIAALTKDKVLSLVARTKKFQDEIMNGRSNENQILLRRYVKFVKIISILFWISASLVVDLYLLPGILALFDINDTINEDGTIIKILPYSLYLPFDQQKHYVAAFFTQMLLCYPGAAYVAVWDTFMFTLMMSAICQLKVLQKLFICLGQEDVITTKQSADKLIKLHQEIIQFIEDLNSLISNVIFLDFLVYALLLCSIGFRAMFDINASLPNIISNAVYLVVVLSQLYMFYAPGNLIMEESAEIANAIWSSDWYLFEKPIVTSLNIVMIRAQKPLRLTVGKFYVVNLESLVIILRAWYSYMTILNQMKEN